MNCNGTLTYSPFDFCGLTLVGSSLSFMIDYLAHPEYETVGGMQFALFTDFYDGSINTSV